MRQSSFDILAFARLESLAMIARRAAGLKSCSLHDFLPQVSEQDRATLQSLARQIRGEDDRPPAIFIHGVLPRSGTNLLSDILALHPDTLQNPGRLWEFPLLRVANGANALQNEFRFMFPANGEVMTPHMVFTILAQGWMRALRHGESDARMIIKSPHMHHIGLFDAVFPDEKLILVIRDGRDVVASSLTSFGQFSITHKGFSTLAHEWAAASEAALTTAARLKHQAMLVRFEDLASANPSVIRTLLRHAGLDPARYPWKSLNSLPVRGTSELALQGRLDWMEKPKPANFNPIGRWQQWPDRWKRKFNSIAGEALIKSGYEGVAKW